MNALEQISNPLLHDELVDRPNDLIVIGSAMLEQVITLPAWPISGHQMNVPISDITYSAGGGGVNVSCTLSRLGGRAKVVAKIGEGDYGVPVYEELINSGVDVSLVQRIPDCRGNFIIILTHEKGNWTALTSFQEETFLTVEDFPSEDTFSSSKMLYVSGFVYRDENQKKFVERAVEIAQHSGNLIAVDAAVPASLQDPKYMLSLLKRGDISFLNVLEACAISLSSTLEEAIEKLRQEGPDLCFIKRGERGCSILTQDTVRHVPAYEVDTIDTIGSGDAFVAATLFAISRGKDVIESAKWGNAAGALNCLGHGSLSYRFGLEEIESLINRGEAA